MAALAEQHDGSYFLDPNEVRLWRFEARAETGEQRIQDELLLADADVMCSRADFEDLVTVIRAIKKEGVEVWLSMPKDRKKLYQESQAT